MRESVKYAILDTDFVFKTNIIKADDRVLADEVLAFPRYRFASPRFSVRPGRSHPMESGSPAS